MGSVVVQKEPGGDVDWIGGADGEVQRGVPGGAAGGQELGDAPERTRATGLHRLVCLLVGLVWPLIWVGGLVTTYDAGMSVPDWPGTYGYNLFLYPYKTWLLGPFDLFIEHGHRLLGAVVGLVAIAVFVASLRTDGRIENRRGVRWLCGGVLAMVIAQGILGGFRVVLSDRTLAMIHGCFGPAFFAVCTVTLVVTSRWWQNLGLHRSGEVLASQVEGGGARFGFWAGLLMVAMAYGQLVLGAMMRHVSPLASASHFAGVVGLHVAGAFALWAVSAAVWWRIARHRRRGSGGVILDGLSTPAKWLFVFVGAQISLGVATWVVNYGYPSLLLWVPGSESFLIRAKGFVDSMIVTGHVATGSLVLATATFLATRGYRAGSIEPTTMPSP